MSKAISYYDWELNFRKKAVLKPNSRNKTGRKISQGKINSLGLSDNAFKDFMKKWKSENLSLLIILFFTHIL